MLEIIKLFVRRMLMGKGKGILQVAPKKNVDDFAKDLYKKFKDNGVPDGAVKNPKDVKVIWNQITNREAQIFSTKLEEVVKPRAPGLPKKSAEVIPFQYKKTFKQEIEEMGKKREPAPTVGGKTIEEVLGGKSWADRRKIEKMTPGDVIPKETLLTKDKSFRIKQGLSTKIKLNTLGENKQFAKELVTGKNSEFNTLDKAAKREVLDRLEINIKNAKADFATPVKPEDLASGGRIGYGGGKGVDLDRRMILKGLGALAALPVVGKFFKLAKPLAKTRDIRIKFKQDADWSYEGPESGWEGGSWLNLDFVPLTKKGTKILDDLAKNKKIEKSIDGKETYYGVANSEDGLMAVEDIKKMKGDMEIETTVSDKVKNSLKGKYETTKIYSGKDIDSKTILKESADDLVTDPIYADPVFTDEFTEEIINTINPIVKKASGGIAGQLHLNRPGFEKGKKVDLSKRKFMKGAGAGLGVLSMLPFVGKFFKPAAKAVSKAAKVTKFPDGEPSYLADLIAVVKAKGKSSVGGYQDTISVHRYKNVEVIEDAAGGTKIKHEKQFDIGQDHPGYRENQMELTKVDEIGSETGETFYKQEGMGDELHSYDALETEKYTNAKLYDEGTVRPDPNDPGKFKDDLDAIREADHLELKEIADEAKDLMIKKASGGIAGQLHMNRQGYEGGKIVEGKGIYEPPQNKYGIGLTSILEDVMRDAPKKGTWNEKDLEYIWDIMQGEHDIENIEDELMLRFGRMNPEKKSKFFAEIGKGKVGFGWKKQFASGGLAGQLHMNQGGAAWPAGRERFSEEWNLTDAYKEMLDTRLSAMEVSSTPPDQQDIDSISNYYNNLKEKGVDTTKFDKRIQNLLQPPKPSSGLSHILGV